MTPQEINDHKRKWIMADYYNSHVHSDYRSAVVDWCKDNCFQWRYDIKKFTDVYGDTVRFELEEDFASFNDWYGGKNEASFLGNKLFAYGGGKNETKDIR